MESNELPNDDGVSSENRQTVINWVSRLVLDLCSDPDLVSIKTRVDEKGLLIEVFAPKSELGRLIGKQGRTANAVRELAYNYGSRHACRVSIKINGVEDDAKEPGVSTIE